MKSNIVTATLAFATLFALPTFASPSQTAKSAEVLLATHGIIHIESAGPYVGRGTYRIQVLAKLGEPDARLADGSWLYNHFRVKGSNAEGGLIVRFREGQVSSLALASPARLAVMRAADQRGAVHLANAH